MDNIQNAQKLTTFMKVSIAILAAVTLASISLLFIGDFEGKFERVFSTLSLFAVFVLLTAFDTRRERKNEWYAPIALIANTYILGLLLIVIWITPYEQVILMSTIVWKSVFVIGTTRLVTFGLELLLKVGIGKPVPLGRWGLVTSIFAVLTLVLFTAPTGIEAFRLSIPALYWKIAVATLILTALGLAITLLLNWYYTSSQKEEQAKAAPALLPWPTFADGTPLPQLADGQPDFSVLQGAASVAPEPVHTPAPAAAPASVASPAPAQPDAPFYPEPPAFQEQPSAPVVEAPAVEAPAVEVPVAEVPAVDVPVAEVPVADVPVAGAEASVLAEPGEAPVAAEPAPEEYHTEPRAQQ